LCPSLYFERHFIQFSVNLGALRSVIDQETIIESNDSNVKPSRWRYANQPMSSWIFKTLFIVVVLFTAIQKTDSAPAIFLVWPSARFVPVTGPISWKQISVFLGLLGYELTTDIHRCIFILWIYN
jgi:hypothetical protein